jgi:aspartyl-tRNA(Asn)/glutamyl-tRNA(Gln) amidotransferase subunit C
MPISMEEARHVARLARLELEDRELEEVQVKLEALLDHFQDIAAIDVTGLPAKPHAVSLSNVNREDVAQAHLTRSEALKNSAKTKAGLFIVPTILEESH